MESIMSPQQMIEMFTVKVESGHTIEQISSKISAACETYKFSLLQTYIYHEILESKGFPIKRKVFIYEICQAKVAALMLADHPEFSVFMPCKISIYENEGKTILSTMNMELVLGVLEDNKVLFSETMRLFNSLKEMLNSLAL